MWVTIKWVTISFFGSLIGHYIIHHQYLYRTISKNTLVFLQTFFIPMIIFVLYLARNHFYIMMVMVTLLLLSGFAVVLWSTYDRKLKFEKHLSLFLKEAVLNLKSGKSLRVTLSKLVRQAPYCLILDYQEILAALEYDQGVRHNIIMTPAARTLEADLRDIMASNNRIIDKMMSLRDHYQREAFFKKKIEVAAAQSKAQILVCFVLYVFLIFMVGFNTPSFLGHPLFMVSITLFIVGIIITKILTNKMKLKV